MFNKFIRGKDPKDPKDGKKKKEVKKYTPPEPLTKEELARLEITRQGLFARPDGRTDGHSAADTNGLRSLHRDSSQSSLTPSMSSSESQQSLNVSSSQQPPSGVARRTSAGYQSKTGALDRGRSIGGGSSFDGGNDGGGGDGGGSNNNSLSRPKGGILKGVSKYGPTIPNQGVSEDIDDDTTLYVNTNVNELIAAGEPAAIAAAAAAAKETHSNSPSPLMSGPISAKRNSTISNVSSTSHASLTPSMTTPSAATSHQQLQQRPDSTSGPLPCLREKSFDDVELVLPPLAPALPPASRSVTLQRSPKGDFGFSLRRSAVLDKHSADSASKKNVIFAEPLAVGSGNTTGLLPGDRLVSVNGVNVEAASREEIIEHIRKSGSSLQLTVQPILELSELSNRKSSVSTTLKSAPSDPVRKHGTLQGMRRHTVRLEAEIAAERNWTSKNRVWLLHTKGFSAAVRSDETLEGSVQIMLDSGGNLEVEEEDVEKMNVPSMDRVENVALLPFLNESSVLHVLRQRYGSNLVHTFAGPHLVTINPMHSLSVYAEKVMQLFRGCKLEDLPPHIYATAQSAYRSLLTTRKDQSILLLGRSGSGKTSNARHLIHYLTAIAGSINNVLSVEKLNALSTLLEAFGNTRTTMNTNATRFSQVTALEFDYSGQVIGASLQVFLLEKSRVCRRPEGEPTFHIFYHLLAGCDSDLRSELQLQILGDTNIFMTPPTKAEDKQRASTIWERISKAMETLSVKKDESRAIWSVLAAIYHLGCAGAVKGSGGGGADKGSSSAVVANRPQFAKPVPAQKAAALLGTSIEELSRAIFAPQTHHAASSSNALSPRSPASLSRSLTPSHSPSGTLDRSSPSASSLSAAAGSNIPNSTAAAIEMLEAFVISLYSEAFSALLSLINRNLSSSTAGKHRSMASISILDCPGLQTPKSSSSSSKPKGASFEDLCHNYLQERLLNVFHDQAFTIPLERYAQENISLSENSSASNGGGDGGVDLGDLDGVGGLATPLADIISVIDKPSQHGRVSSGRSSMDFSTGADRVGLFWLLEEESIFPGSSDDSFVDRLFVHHQSASVDGRSANRASLLSRPSLGSSSSEPIVSEPTLRFTLHHLNATCPVTYNAKGWLKASRDQLTAKLAPVVLQESNREQVSTLFNAVRGPLPPSTLQGSLAGLESSSSSLRRVASVRRSFNATSASKRKSLCVQIKCQTDSLVETLRRTNCHFVHCLLPKRDAGLCDMKPPTLTNGDTSPSPIASPTSPFAENCVDVPLLREQLRGFKLLEAVRLHRHGYPEHMLTSEFRRSFEILAPPEVRSVVSPLDETKAAKELFLNHLELDKNLCKFGLSRIFFRAGALADLEDKRDARVASTFSAFQARCRGFLVRRRLHKLQVQDLAIRCIQKNLRKYHAVRQWPWWSLYTKVIPLLNVHRTEEELTAANEEIEALKQKFGKIEKEKNSFQERNDFLESKLTEITTDLQEEQTTATHASELLDGEVAERIRLEKEMKDVSTRNANLQKKVDNLEMELYEARMINAQLDQTADDDDELDASFFKQKHDRVARELALCRNKLDEQRDEAEEKCEAVKKTMERRLNEANAETEEAQRQLTSWKRNAQRLNGQLQDLKLISEEQQTKNAELEKKQRKFDAEIARERQEANDYKDEKDKLQRERDSVVADRFALEAEVSRLKGDMDLSTAKIERLEHELQDISTTNIGGDQEVLKLKRVKHELEMKLKEAEEELDEQAGTIQQLEQAKLKLEMQSSKTSIQHQKDLDLKEEELEQSRFATQKRIKTLELQLEDEHEEKSQLLREKRNAEKQLRDLMERSPKRDKGAEKRLRGKLKRTSALLRDTQMALEKSSSEGGGGAVKSLRNQLEDAEFAKQAASKAKSSIEMELSDVQAQLEQVLLTKQDAERKAMDAARQNHDLQSQLDEANDEILDVMKKYKAAVQQASVEHITVNDLLGQIAESDREKASMSEQLATLQAKVAYLENSCVEKAEMTRVEAKVRDLEGRLELETGQKNRLDTQLSRLKETNDKLAADVDDFKAAAEREKDLARRAMKTAKDAQEEMAEMKRKDEDGSMKKSELESRASSAEEALETAQSDLKLAFKRIQDLQSALEDQMADSESDLLTDSDDDDDDDVDDSDDDDFLRNRRPLNKSSGLGSAASSNRASLQSLDDASSSSASRLHARRMESYAGSIGGGNSVYGDDDDL